MNHRLASVFVGISALAAMSGCGTTAPSAAPAPKPASTPNGVIPTSSPTVTRANPVSSNEDPHYNTNGVDVAKAKNLAQSVYDISMRPKNSYYEFTLSYFNLDAQGKPTETVSLKPTVIGGIFAGKAVKLKASDSNFRGVLRCSDPSCVTGQVTVTHNGGDGSSMGGEMMFSFFTQSISTLQSSVIGAAPAETSEGKINTHLQGQKLKSGNMQAFTITGGLVNPSHIQVDLHKGNGLADTEMEFTANQSLPSALVTITSSSAPVATAYVTADVRVNWGKSIQMIFMSTTALKSVTSVAAEPDEGDDSF